MFEYREGPVLTLNYIRFKSKGTASLFSQRFRESDEHLRPVLEDYHRPPHCDKPSLMGGTGAITTIPTIVISRKLRQL